MAKGSKVIVYSTPTCPYCKLAKAFLKNNHIPFEEIDVSQDREKAMEMVEKSGQAGVPVIDVDGEIIIGYNQARLRELLQNKSSRT